MKRSLQQLIAFAWIVAGAPFAAGGARADSRTLHVYNSTPEEVKTPTVRTYFQAPTDDEAENEAFRRQLIADGARNVNWFGADVIVCDLPVHKDGASMLASSSFARSARFDGFLARMESQIPDYVPGRSDGFLSQVKHAYAMAERLADPDTPKTTTGEHFRDVVNVITPEESEAIQKQIRSRRPRMQRSSSETGEAMRNVQQNSEILTGSIKVYLIFPESNGSVDNKTETWKNDVGTQNQDYLDARTHAFAALLDYQGQFPAMGINFRVIDLMPDCNYEPIHHGTIGDTDDLWIMDAMRRLDPELGFTENPITAVHAWNEERRDGYDWIFTMFIAHSRNEATHQFRNANYTAYANLGGPYLVNPYPAGLDPNIVGENLVYSQVVQHETGHVFWTLDEYESDTGSCTARSGYLDYDNQNKDVRGPGGTVHCIPSIDCIMKYAAREDLGRPFCRWSLGQLGVIDDNDNTIPDVFEAPPLIRFEPPVPDTIDVDNITIYIKAISQAVPNRNPRQDPNSRVDYAAPLKSAEFGLGGPAWFPLDADDGRWDGQMETARLDFDALPPGETIIRFRVRNSVGMWSSEYEKRIFFLGVAYGSFTVTPTDDFMEIKWEKAGGAASARFDVYRLNPDDAEPVDLRKLEYGDEMPGELVAGDVQPDPKSAGNWYIARDPKVAPGVRYRYYITGYGVENEGQPNVTYYRSTTVTKGQTAMVPIPSGKVISYAAPNPTNGEVTFSVNVPRPDPRIASQAQPDPTPVSVVIYDVLGRRVKEIHDGREYETVLTLRWDGTTINGGPASSGFYFIRVKSGANVATQKILLIR